MQEIKHLIQAVEEAVGHTISSNFDFTKLSDAIFEKEHERISTSTLMRMWGYRPFVQPRKSTLDILARFVGYKDSVDFFNSVSADDTPEQAPAAPVVPKTSKRRSWFIFAIVATVVLLAALLFVFLKGESSPRRVLSVDEISNTKMYRITSQHGARGELGVIEYQLATTYELAKNLRCLSSGRFAILQYEGAYYLYSVDDKRFVNFTRHEVEVPVACDGAEMKLTKRDSCFVISFSWRDTDFTLNMNIDNGIIITDYGLATDNFDEGNCLEIYEEGDFDPTEPLQRIKQHKAGLEKARQTLVAEQTCRIYTLSGNDDGKDTTRYYLAANGTLTDTYSDSCRFTLHEIAGDTLYASPSFRVCFHTSAEPTPTGCTKGFTYVKYGRDTLAKLAGHLEVTDYWGDTNNGQVFFLGADGLYAVRCTCTPVSAWYAGAYWGVATDGRTGRPVIDYSPAQQFVWHVERVSN